MSKTEHILIIGAGLCGSMLALRLAQHQYNITLVEKRQDLRQAKLSAGRSINLAFSNRGLKAFKRVGLEDRVKALCIPMHGRMLHDQNSKTKLSKYSGRDGEYINSISRPGLNALLLDELENYPNVNVKFEMACQEVNLEQTSAEFELADGSKQSLEADYIFGTDGAGSAVRKAMQAKRDFLFSHSQDFLTHGYKELSFPPTKNGDYATEPHALHIWPRGENMIIALPNQDKSFTVTLFLAYEGGRDNFNNLTTPEAVSDYFKREYPDAFELMPRLTEEFFENPTAPLGTVRCNPWTYHNCLIMGDAAHAIVPFYGQGMNASFEDVVEFDDSLEATNFDLKASLEHFSRSRKVNADAIADLALDNFHEMKAHTAQELFQQKREIELALEEEFPQQYFSKYSLVTFQEQVPYKTAMDRGRAQDQAILSLLKHQKLHQKQTREEQLHLIRNFTEQILKGEYIINL